MKNAIQLGHALAFFMSLLQHINRVLHTSVLGILLSSSKIPCPVHCQRFYFSEQRHRIILHKAWSPLVNPLFKVTVKNAYCMQLQYKYNGKLFPTKSRTQNFRETPRMLLRKEQLGQLPSKIQC